VVELGPQNVKITRRAFVRNGAFAVLARGGATSASPIASATAGRSQWRHGVSLFGDLKYPPGFPRFDYVEPNAPKGGSARQGAIGTYDNFNTVIAGVKGNLAAGIDLIYDTLLLPSLDEPASEYGLLAEAVAYPEDFSWARYRLHAQAKWHDGAPVTAEDVVFSFYAFQKKDPRLAIYYRHVVKAEITADREIMFTFDASGNRELPQIVGQLTVLPKHWWNGKDPAGRRRDIAATTLEAPLGSGPYRIKTFEPGRTIIYERVSDYWAGDLNLRRGCNNFDELRFDYFRDLTVAFEAFKAGDLDWRVENSARTWATGYDFPALVEGRVVREEFPIRNVGVMQGFAFNLRRSKFKDARVRRAFNFAFDFESVNKDVFYGQYERISSYFQGTELAASGLPQGLELEILQGVRDGVPEEVFATPYWNPVAGSATAVRKNLLHATKLLSEAGFRIEDLELIDPETGAPMRVEFLIDNVGYEPFALFYRASLQRLGIEVAIRVVDPVQYENRLRQWDFDMIINSWWETLSPGNEQRDYWGSQAADMAGSGNIIGIKNHAVDALIKGVVFARNRAELVAATKALDRVLLWNHYVVPQWTYEKLRTARWSRFGHPRRMPIYGASAFPTVWWEDEGSGAVGLSRS
jgi:microcin C transport system substrate-binding protein